MKNLSRLCAAVLAGALFLGGCANKIQPEELAGKTYQYEKDGFGGSFIIRLEEDGTFTYYEGSLSSYIGAGDWALEGETLTLQEKNRHFTFRAERNCLVFQKEQSGDFTYIRVSDQEKFTAETE